MSRLVLSDVHANSAALEAVLGAEPGYEEVLFLGDAVDYGPDPNATVDLLSNLEGAFLMGNHDRKMIRSPKARRPDGRRDFSQWTRDTLTAEHLAELRTYRDTAITEVGGRRVRLHHGDFRDRIDDLDITRRLTPRNEYGDFDAVAACFDADVILFGHSHEQFELTVNGTRFVNPGSVGRSNRNGIAAQYAVIDDGHIKLHETYFDATETISAMETISIDISPTMWRRCLKRELYRVRRESGSIPTPEHIADTSRYQTAHFVDEFGSLEAALSFAGLD